MADTDSTTQAPTRASRNNSARKNRPWLTAITIVVIVVALAGLGYLGYQFERGRRAEAKLDTAADLLASVEDDVLAIDAVAQAEITSELATAAADAIGLVEATKATIAEAAAVVEEARPDLPDDALGLADALEQAASSRVEMLIVVPQVLEADLGVASALGPADEAWALVAEAEAFAQRASAEFNRHTAAGVKASTENSTKAQDKLTAAASALATATASFPPADLTPFTEYVAAKAALLKSSKEIDALWLAGKIENANAKLDAYNKQDQAVVALAKKLPTSPRTVIADAYDAATASALERYFAARDSARAADGVIRQLTEKSGE
jgi:hypothetical protein